MRKPQNYVKEMQQIKHLQSTSINFSILTAFMEIFLKKGTKIHSIVMCGFATIKVYEEEKIFGVKMRVGCYFMVKYLLCENKVNFCF